MEDRITFSHKSVGSISVKINPDEIAWSYNLNTANFPTYGGEVVQILSVYIDDVVIKGTVRTYREMEAIYSYFAQYMIRASQGETGKGSFNQSFMEMTYHPRGWSFQIQPLSIPGFKYSRETVAPEWRMKAHIADTSAGNYEELKDMIATSQVNGESLKLEGIISPAAADPTQNPFSAPVTSKNGKFVPETVKEVEARNSSLADYYNQLIPSYIHGEYQTLAENLGSIPAFGRSQHNDGKENEVFETLSPQTETEKVK